ncbi:hypothetical protein BDZ89DRAFT_1058607 [Hymenopellis radicata]|nr:hypothetical protein BDZ89DRAFT_1058607 [Hymenopellis radicata]
MTDFMSPSCLSSSSYTSFSERHLGSHHLFSSSTEPESVGRQALIQTLDDSISSDEQNVQNLLKAFDISVRDIQRVDSEPSLPAPPFPELILDIPTTSTPLRAKNTDRRHPFLSTPLRLKHFSKLSPTILRGLLRSPSVRADSSDGSLSDDLASDYFFDDDAALVPESPVARVFPADKENPAKSADSDFFGRAGGPMTPPLTGRIPECAKLPSLSYAPLQRSMDFEDTSPLKNGGGLKPGAADPEEFVSPFPSPPLETERHSVFLPTQHHSMPAATIEQFRRVIDELGGPSSRKSISERRDAPPLPKVHVKPRVHIPSPISPPGKKAGFLEVEFAGLLLERAENEDDEAEELSRMVDRLRHLAECRRVLARVIKD